MKRIYVYIALMVFSISLAAQENDTTKIGIGEKNILTVTEEEDRTNVNVSDELVVVDETDDTIKVKLGNKAISITDDDDRTHIEIIEEKDFDEHGWKKKPEKFKGHWAGFEIGLNSLVDNNWQMAGSEPEHVFLDLNTSRSWEVDINFMQFNMPFGKSLGLVTGMGLKWNNYRFDGNNSIIKDANNNNVIIPKDPPIGAVYDKSKLNTTYLTVPLIYEMHFGKKKKGFIGIGAIGDLKLFSNTKEKYILNGSKEKDRSGGDFNLSPLRYHLTVRAGYKAVKLFANYSMVSLFEKNMGPELYPITVGLTLINFR